MVGNHKEVFAVALVIFRQKCYNTFIDNVISSMYHYY